VRSLTLEEPRIVVVHTSKKLTAAEFEMRACLLECSKFSTALEESLQMGAKAKDSLSIVKALDKTLQLQLQFLRDDSDSRDEYYRNTSLMYEAHELYWKGDPIGAKKKAALIRWENHGGRETHSFHRNTWNLPPDALKTKSPAGKRFAGSRQPSRRKPN
jgi:hypothetical protein